MKEECCIELSKESIIKVKGLVSRERIKAKMYWKDNAITSLSEFYSRNSCKLELEDDKMFAADLIVNINDDMIILTLKNMIKNLKQPDLILYIDSTCKLTFIGFPAHVLEHVDNQWQFHPVVFVVFQRKNESLYRFLFNAAKITHSVLFDNVMLSKYVASDCCNAIFNVIEIEFASAKIIYCYFNIMHNV